MKNSLLSIFLFTIFSNKIIAQIVNKTDCEEYKKQNGRLVSEKKSLQEDFDNLDDDYQKLLETNRIVTRQRDEYKRKYLIEKNNNDELRSRIKNFEKEINNNKEEISKLKGIKESLAKFNLKGTADYDKAVLKIDSLTAVNKKSDSLNKKLNDDWNNRQEAIDILTKRVQVLEDELNDYISLKNKKVYFADSIYDFDKEIIFIQYYGNTPDKNVIPDSANIEYSLKRLARLVKKYDFRIKFKLIGESGLNDKKDRIKLAEDRAQNLLSYLIVNCGLTSDSFTNLSKVTNEARTGVSVQIVMRK